MSRRVSVLALLATLLLSGLTPATVAAANTALPLPDTMAAVGDSITQAASTGGTLGADYPNNSWSTGGNSNINSHLLRLRAEGANPTATNLSVSGAKVVDLEAQMVLAAPLKPDYLTVLIGGNDLCTDTVGEMTDATVFGDQFEAALDVLYTGSPATAIYVVSIPDAHQLWSLFKSSFWARFIWSSAQICQSLLANPTSNQQADVERRAEVRARNMAYNAEMAQVCASYEGTCLYDGGAAFNTPLVKSDVSGDYFHPSVAGQAKLSSVSWSAGYTWTAGETANQPPTAAFASSCSGLTCSFTDGSSDGDGTIASRSWNFGDGATSSATNPSRTYASGGTFTVSLTVTDDDGATGTASRAVTVSAPSAAKMRVADLSGNAVTLNRNTWSATVTITVTDTNNVLVSNATVSGSFVPGGAASCTTSDAGTCTVNVSLGVRKVASTTFTVSGMTGPLLYEPAQNIEGSVTLDRPN